MTLVTPGSGVDMDHFADHMPVDGGLPKFRAEDPEILQHTIEELNIKHPALHLGALLAKEAEILPVTE
ncbi:MAG: hypothetical protein WCJ86_04160 [Candidatus Saccharibacteria bacterium]|jgi:hypothetical protein